MGDILSESTHCSINACPPRIANTAEKIAEPMTRAFPPHKAGCGVLMVYEVFVDEVFINPVWEPDLGGGD